MNKGGGPCRETWFIVPCLSGHAEKKIGVREVGCTLLSDLPYHLLSLTTKIGSHTNVAFS